MIDKNERSKIGRRNRRAGAIFERAVAAALNERLPFGYRAKRRMQYRGGYNEPDVGVYHDDDHDPLWHIECKTGERVSLQAAQQQALEQARDTSGMAVVIRHRGRRPQAYMYLLDWFGPLSLDELAREISLDLLRERPLFARKNRAKQLAERHSEGAGPWLRLVNDGDKAVGIFLGEPYAREVHSSLRVAINFYTGKEVKVFEMGTATFKDLLKVRDKYGLDKWLFEIERHGAAGDPKTTYSILPEKRLTDKQLAEIEKLELHDLQKLYESGGSDAAGSGEDM